jgi:hypothetical protein
MAATRRSWGRSVGMVAVDCVVEHFVTDQRATTLHLGHGAAADLAFEDIFRRAGMALEPGSDCIR